MDTKINENSYLIDWLSFTIQTDINGVGKKAVREFLEQMNLSDLPFTENENLALKFASFFPSYMKAYTSEDVIGAEVCGAYKNVIAIAGGICDGLGLGNNARASLISRGLVEMARFGKFFGAKDETFMGLSGAGDLFLTASSILSRNYRVGLGIARHERLEKILNELGEVAEGVDTARAISKIAKEKGIYVPIASEVENMLNGKDVFESVKSLLGRR